MQRTIFIFGGLAAAIFLLFELSKISLLNPQISTEIFMVNSGVSFITVGVLLHKIFTEGTREPKPSERNNSILTKQEHRVLSLVADGMSNKEIAEELFIAESTVKTHVSNVLSKLNAKRRTEAVRIGHDLEII